jgi:hypothetical protein
VGEVQRRLIGALDDRKGVDLPAMADEEVDAILQIEAMAVGEEVDTEETARMVVTAIAREVGAHMGGGREVRAPQAAVLVAHRHEDRELQLVPGQGVADGEEARAIPTIHLKAGVRPAVARDEGRTETSNHSTSRIDQSTTARL